MKDAKLRPQSRPDTLHCMFCIPSGGLLLREARRLQNTTQSPFCGCGQAAGAQSTNPTMAAPEVTQSATGSCIVGERQSDTLERPLFPRSSFCAQNTKLFQLWICLGIFFRGHSFNRCSLATLGHVAKQPSFI